MLDRYRSLAFFVFAGSLSASPILAATTVNYQGYLYNFNGAPIDGGVVIAGTFAPSFHPPQDLCDYGDAGCNFGTEYFRLAVADGKLFPIGTGASTDSAGFFSGTGMSNDPAGTPIYLFGFQSPAALTVGGGDFGALATSTDASYQIPVGGGPANIDAALANVFILGKKYNGGLAVDVLPFPEPSSVILAIVGVAGLLLLGNAQPRRSQSA
jgi:hypothetical protein